MSKLLKPDGLRGIAITEFPCELLLHLGRAAAQAIGRTCNRSPVFFIAHDPRRSADALEAALCAGICSGGGTAHCFGVLPSAAMALLLSIEDADAGIALTAEGSAYEYNGLHWFEKNGAPMSMEQLASIEALMPGGMPLPAKSHRFCGTIVRDETAGERYLTAMYARHTKTTVLETTEEMPSISVRGPADGMRVALDCANGAVSLFAEPLFAGCGAEVLLLNAEPDGLNINKDCGVQSMETLMEFVKAQNCQVGFAFDGDGGRCLAVDDKGELVDGDRILAILANHALSNEALEKQGVAATVMSNLGFLRFAQQHQITVYQTQPAPRFVLEKMQSTGLSLGGERSGYLFFRDMPAADGLCTALRLCQVMQETGQSLNALSNVMEHDPQVSVTVRIAPYWREIWKNETEITEYIAQCAQQLGSDGRILVRELGRDAAIQILLEGRDFRRINGFALDIAAKIKERAGGSATSKTLGSA